MLTDNSPPNAEVASNGGGVSSPLSRRRSLPSPWASVVRGDSEQNSSPTAAAGASGSSSPPPAEQLSAPDNSLVESSGSESQPESSDVNGDSNAGRPRRPAWNRPLNDVVEPVSVMGGAISWPALSETTRPIQRSSSDISRSVSDGSASPTQAPIISQPPQRPANNNAHANSTANNPMPTRPRSRNRTGGGGGGGGSSSGSGPSQNTFNQPSLPMPPPFSVFEAPYRMVPAVMDTSMRGPRPVGAAGVSQSHSGNEHSPQRNNSRRGYGPRPRGDGQYHNNHGGRRDQDRRDVHHAPQYVPPPMGYIPTPLSPAAPFMPPPPVRVFPGQMGFVSDMATPLFYVPTLPPESFRNMPIVPPPPPMHFPPANENPLTNLIIKQIDFYFSDENLVKDEYLRGNMDDHGWVPISLIASFRRVQQLTQEIPVILEALRHSTVVEVQGDKVRRRNEWPRFVHSANRVSSDSGSYAPGATSESALATSLQEASLDDGMATNANGNVGAMEGHMDMAAGRVLPNEMIAQSELANGEDTAEEARSISV